MTQPITAPAGQDRNLNLVLFTKDQLGMLAQQPGPLRRRVQQELLKRGNAPDPALPPAASVAAPAPVSTAALATAVLNALPTAQVQQVQAAVDAQALVQRAEQAEAAATAAQEAATAARAAADAAVAALPEATPEATVQAAVTAVTGQDASAAPADTTAPTA